jgi:hypothetical protein
MDALDTESGDLGKICPTGTIIELRLGAGKSEIAAVQASKRHVLERLRAKVAGRRMRWLASRGAATHWGSAIERCIDGSMGAAGTGGQET